MAVPFSSKKTDFWIVALSLVPVLAYVFLGGADILSLGLNWLASGVVAWIVWGIFEQFHLGLFNRNHSFSISWVVVSVVLNFASANFVSQKMFGADLILLGGFVVSLLLVVQTWQNETAPLAYFLSGLVVGAFSSFSPTNLFWLLLFPAFLFHLRAWSLRNWGSLFSGILFAIWVAYCSRLFIFGAADADAMILSYGQLFGVLFAFDMNVSLCEWLFLGAFSFILIIYSILGYSLNIVRSVKSESFLLMVSTLTLIALFLCVIDLGHLVSYLAILAVLLSFLLSIIQSCLVNKNNDWCTLFLIVLLVVFSLIPLFTSDFIAETSDKLQDLLPL